MTIIKLFFFVHFKTIKTYLKIIISIKSTEMPLILYLTLNFIRGKFNLILKVIQSKMYYCVRTICIVVRL